MRKTLVATLLLLTGCGSMQMQPVDLGLEVKALGGLFTIKPQISVGDGKVGPSAVEVEFKQEEEGSEAVATDDD